VSAAPDPETVALIRSIMMAVGKGDLPAARATAEQALASGRGGAIVEGLLGTICCQSGDLEAGIQHLGAALDAMPEDVGMRANLATALQQAGRGEAALDRCDLPSCERDPSFRLWRMRAYLLQTAEDFDGAARAYGRVVAAMPDDFESWNNLGNARAALGDGPGSAEALRCAAELRPDVAPVRLNLATTLREIGEWDEALAVVTAATRDFRNDAKFLRELAYLHKLFGRDAESLDALERAAALEPRDADLQVAIASERMSGWDMAGAEDAIDNAIAIDPVHGEAHIFRAFQHEHNNRIELLRPLLSDATARGVDPGALHLIEALALRREQRFAEGLAALSRVPEEMEPIRRAQLAGQFHDRLGDADAAFAAFAEMNRQQTLDPSQPVYRADLYRAKLEQDRALVTPGWFAGWTPPSPSPHPSPAFLVGFPRSGTTLLDTLLMGHPGVTVLEEKPPLRRVEEALGDVARLPGLDAEEIGRLRAVYFEEAARHAELDPAKLLIDKFPLHLNKVPIIHRLFPDARFILALRHPCDVVLSCFITNFRLNDAMSSFLSLENVARIYDLSFGFWEQARAIVPIRSHSVMYERMVSDIAAELRPLFDYLGLDWRDEVLDHRRTAKARGVISTASYAQVTEPLYDRAAGRWTRYRHQLEPVLPVLQPWIERYGYAL